MPFVSIKWVPGVLLPNVAHAHPPQTPKKIGSYWILADECNVAVLFYENWTVEFDSTVQKLPAL
jgi:hypothetical protein